MGTLRMPYFSSKLTTELKRRMQRPWTLHVLAEPGGGYAHHADSLDALVFDDGFSDALWEQVQQRGKSFDLRPFVRRFMRAEVREREAEGLILTDRRTWGRFREALGLKPEPRRAALVFEPLPRAKRAAFAVPTRAQNAAALAEVEARVAQAARRKATRQAKDAARPFRPSKSRGARAVVREIGEILRRQGCDPQDRDLNSCWQVTWKQAEEAYRFEVFQFLNRFEVREREGLLLYVWTHYGEHDSDGMVEVAREVFAQVPEVVRANWEYEAGGVVPRERERAEPNEDHPCLGFLVDLTGRHLTRNKDLWPTAAQLKVFFKSVTALDRVLARREEGWCALDSGHYDTWIAQDLGLAERPPGHPDDWPCHHEADERVEGRDGAFYRAKWGARGQRWVKVK
jgi:hypothetical protein